VGRDAVARATSDLFEWDLVTSTARTVGTGYAQMHSIVANQSRLLAGMANGDILDIDPATGASTSFASTGLGPINSMAIDPVSGEVYFATVVSGSHEVYALGNTTRAIYSTANVIRDIGIGVRDHASLLFHGFGCAASNALAPGFGFVNLPTLGSQVTLRMEASRARRRSCCWASTAPGSTSRRSTRRLLRADQRRGHARVNVNAAGIADYALAIPNNGSQKGARLAAQFAMLDGANPLGLVSSEGAEAILR
jgi:hypothetical protein